MVDGVVNQWLKAPGEFVEMGEAVAEIETEKINYQLEATGSGTLHTVVPEGTVVAVDGVLGFLLETGETPPEVAPRAPAAPRPAVTGATPARQPGRAETGAATPSTPGARRLARELGIDIADVPASGPRGRVVEADIRSYDDRRPQPRPNEPVRTELLSGIRKAVASHMLHGITSTAQLTFFLEVDVTEAQRLRREASHGPVTIGLGHVLMKASAEAVRSTPQVNTVLLNGEILHYETVNIGFAVALGRGTVDAGRPRRPEQIDHADCPGSTGPLRQGDRRQDARERPCRRNNDNQRSRFRRRLHSDSELRAERASWGWAARSKSRWCAEVRS